MKIAFLCEIFMILNNFYFTQALKLEIIISWEIWWCSIEIVNMMYVGVINKALSFSNSSDFPTKASVLSKAFCFSKKCKTFLWDQCLFPRYLEGPTNLVNYISEKMWLYYDALIRLYSRNSEKSWDFERMNLKMNLKYSNKT